MKIGTVYQPIVCVARDCSILTQYIEDWWHGTILSLNPEGSFGHRSSKSCIDTLKTKGALPLQWSSQESGVAGPGCEHIGCADARLWCAGQKFEPPAACRDLVSHVAGVFSESQPSVMGAGLAVSILSIYTSKVSWAEKVLDLCSLLEGFGCFGWGIAGRTWLCFGWHSLLSKPVWLLRLVLRLSTWGSAFLTVASAFAVLIKLLGTAGERSGWGQSGR